MECVKAERAGCKPQLAKIFGILEKNPYEQSQGFEKLKGDLKNMYSRRINYHNRVVYDIFPNTENLLDPNGEPYEGIVHIMRAWSHYD
ncbi:MAG: type II toxin-antitoxin system YoeB family toxin [Chitinispirillales bacterium]|nr:type II toxin-antitoxin system YoeB family toxin [Chitinispirillales bacterium]